MSRHRGSSRVDRLVTVVMSDTTHTIHLVEVRAKVRFQLEALPRVDKTAAEEAARSRLTEIGKDESQYDFVGILVAHSDLTPESRGRITWAEEIEAAEAVTV